MNVEGARRRWTGQEKTERGGKSEGVQEKGPNREKGDHVKAKIKKASKSGSEGKRRITGGWQY